MGVSCRIDDVLKYACPLYAQPPSVPTTTAVSGEGAWGGRVGSAAIDRAEPPAVHPCCRRQDGQVEMHGIRAVRVLEPGGVDTDDHLGLAGRVSREGRGRRSGLDERNRIGATVTHDRPLQEVLGLGDDVRTAVVADNRDRAHHPDRPVRKLVKEAYPRAEAIVRERPPSRAKDWNDALRAAPGRTEGQGQEDDQAPGRGRGHGGGVSERDDMPGQRR